MKMPTVLIAALIATALNGSAELFHGDFIYWINFGGTTVSIIGYTGAGGSVEIPSVIDGKGVTEIEENVFLGNADLTSVTIPESVLEIKLSSFQNCTNLVAIEVDAGNPAYSSDEGILFNKTQTTLIQCPGGRGGSYFIPESVTSIYGYAFQSCINLDAIEVSTNNPAYSSHDGVLFNKAQTTLIQCPGGRAGNYTIPDTVTTIERFAFSYCTGLTCMVIPDRVTTIHRSAFSHCTGLTCVFMPDSVTSISPFTLGDDDNRIFGYCTNLMTITVDSNNPAYSSAGGILFNKTQTKLIEYPGGRKGSYTVPDGVTRIGKRAFSASGLTSVMIPASVNDIGIGTGGFNYAVGAFGSCFRLTNITVAVESTHYKSIDGVLFDRNELLEYPGGRTGGYAIPEGTFAIEGSAFNSCTGLTSVTIPDSVYYINDYSFAHCTGLTNVTFGSGLLVIGEGAFSYCTNLTHIALPSGLITIVSLAFENCIGLTSITIPDSLTALGYYVFVNCANLTGIYFQGDAPPYPSESFRGDENATLYYLPGTTGWDTAYENIPTVLWSPSIQSDDDNFGLQAGEFGFNITESESGLVVVEACTNLTNAVWVPMETNSMNNGTVYFSDVSWTNYPNRYYRLSMP